MILAPWHTSWTVSDLSVSERFFCDLLGFTVVHRQEQNNPYTSRLVGIPEVHLKVIQLALPKGQAMWSGQILELVEYVSPKGVRLDTTPNNVCAAHFAMLTDDALDDYQRLIAAGVRFLSPPNAITAGINRGGFTCYFKDPDDFTLELMQPPQAVLHRISGDDPCPRPFPAIGPAAKMTRTVSFLER